MEQALETAEKVFQARGDRPGGLSYKCESILYSLVGQAFRPVSGAWKIFQQPARSLVKGIGRLQPAPLWSGSSWFLIVGQADSLPSEAFYAFLRSPTHDSKIPGFSNQTSIHSTISSFCLRFSGLRDAKRARSLA